MTSVVFKRHFLLGCNDFSIARWHTAQRILGSAALVLHSILVAALVRWLRFGGFNSALCDMWLTIVFVKTVEQNRIRRRQVGTDFNTNFSCCWQNRPKNYYAVNGKIDTAFNLMAKELNPRLADLLYHTAGVLYQKSYL